LIFNDGYTASSESALLRVELTSEAIRMARQLRDRLPDDGEVKATRTLADSAVETNTPMDRAG
jgi:predicted RNA polymerase sigma factor